MTVHNLTESQNEISDQVGKTPFDPLSLAIEPEELIMIENLCEDEAYSVDEALSIVVGVDSSAVGERGDSPLGLSKEPTVGTPWVDRRKQHETSRR